LEEGDAVVATGGGRGVTAAILMEMARRVKLRFLILGRTPLGPPEPSWLTSMVTEEEISKALRNALGDSLTPSELKARVKLSLSEREIKATLKTLEGLGSKAEYFPGGDHLNPEELLSLCRTLKSKNGPIKGLIHGAGVIKDHLILGKSSEDFTTVFNTKALMASLMLEAFQDEPLKLILFMSSSSARFGRIGQADYSAANEVLNKMASEEKKLRPNCRVFSLNFGPWEGGMVTNELAKLFKSEGIALIPLKSGSETVADVLSSGPSAPTELTVLGYGTDLSRLSEFKKTKK
jgi:NAD(P)-dependent dehydrogenase (short-subunit alcohol dehydrogenase family)